MILSSFSNNLILEFFVSFYDIYHSLFSLVLFSISLITPVYGVYVLFSNTGKFLDLVGKGAQIGVGIQLGKSAYNAVVGNPDNIGKNNSGNAGGTGNAGGNTGGNTGGTGASDSSGASNSSGQSVGGENGSSSN